MGRAPCCDKNGLKKGPWTPEEDQKLIDYIQKNGYGNWRTLPKNAGLQRCGKSCRLRWTNYLRPDIKRGRFSFEEEETIIQLHSILGNKWSAIAARLPGRTDNEIKNYWNTHIRKRLLRMGIDPVTHSPRLDLLDLSSILSSSLYNSPHQITLSRSFLGLQPHHQLQLNPELLRIATSLAASSSSQRQNQNVITSNNPDHNSPVQVLHNQCLPPLFQEMPTSTTLTTSCVSFSSEPETHLVDPNAAVWPSNVNNVGLPPPACNSNLNLTDQEYYQLPYQSYTDNYDLYGSEQATILDPCSDTSTTFVSNNNNNFSFPSVLSTPSSSPTPLNSNSNSTNYINSACSTEDERESYCSNILKFEIPDVLDVSNFM